MARRTVEWYKNKFGDTEGQLRFDKNLRYLNREQHAFDHTPEAVKSGDAVQCAECGKYLARIQHTHLKSAYCTGRFQRVCEYMAAYPDVPVIAKNLALKTSVSKEKFNRVYSADEAEIRWKAYCDKQALTNTFEYKSETHGWTREQFDEYNFSRATTLKNLIARHGEEFGLVKWEEYCERQRFTTSREYFIEEYGVELGKQKWLTFSTSRTSQRISKPEQELVRFLTSEDLDVETQCQVDRRIFDIRIGSTLIEFNGDFWHGNPEKFSGDTVHSIIGIPISEIWKYDASKNAAAEALGYRVITVWETEWNKNKAATKAKLLKLLKEQQ